MVNKIVCKVRLRRRVLRSVKVRHKVILKNYKATVDDAEGMYNF